MVQVEVCELNTTLPVMHKKIFTTENTESTEKIKKESLCSPWTLWLKLEA